MKPNLTFGERRAPGMFADVLAQQAREEPNRWYAFRKRQAALKAPARSQEEESS